MRITEAIGPHRAVNDRARAPFTFPAQIAAEGRNRRQPRQRGTIFRHRLARSITGERMAHLPNRPLWMTRSSQQGAGQFQRIATAPGTIQKEGPELPIGRAPLSIDRHADTANRIDSRRQDFELFRHCISLSKRRFRE
jgi:hypothetical protein